MKTFSKFYKIIMLVMVFGLLGVPAAMAHKDSGDNPLYNIPLPSDNGHASSFIIGDVAPRGASNTGDEIMATAALSEQGTPTVIKQFNFDSGSERLVGPTWNSVPGKNE